MESIQCRFGDMAHLVASGLEKCLALPWEACRPPYMLLPCKPCLRVEPAHTNGLMSVGAASNDLEQQQPSRSVVD